MTLLCNDGTATVLGAREGPHGWVCMQWMAKAVMVPARAKPLVKGVVIPRAKPLEQGVLIPRAKPLVKG